jgi:hypothetical protein
LNPDGARGTLVSEDDRDELCFAPGAPEVSNCSEEGIGAGMTAENLGAAQHLLLPTYENRLRIIGRRLDEASYRSVNLVEISGGFLVRGLRPGERLPEALEFPHEDFPTLLPAAVGARGPGLQWPKSHPLLPTGYEDFLRALGRSLDEQHAEAIAIMELNEFIAVNGVAPFEAYHQTTVSLFQAVFRADDIKSLLDDAFRRRKPTDAPSTFGRLLRR